jgi:hypothetical protein
MKVKIYTMAYNRPDFIPLQQMAFSSFLKDDFDFTVFNNSATENDGSRIKDSCSQLGIKCIDVEERTQKTAGNSHATALEWSFHKYIKYNENTISIIIDSDMFLIQEFSANEYLNCYDLAAVPQSRGYVNYLSPELMFFNIDALPDKDHMEFTGGIVEGFPVDIGGRLYYWLGKNKDLKIRYIVHSGQICSENDNLVLVPREMENYQDYRFDILDKAFLHYGAGSNWNYKSEEYHKNKTDCLEKFLKTICTR